MSDKYHRELCELGAKFLKRSASNNGHGCHFAIVEPSVYGENPDVFGVRHGIISPPKTIGNMAYIGGYDVGTVVIEVKTSRSDFLRDKDKKHRSSESLGLGKWRYYLCPEKVIKVEDLPEKWGLLWVTKNGSIKIIAGALAVEKKILKTTYGKDRKIKSMSDLQDSFEAHSFHERHHQNEVNLLTMALARLDGVEDILYIQREKLATETKLQNRVFKLEEELRQMKSQLTSYTAQNTLENFKQKIAIPQKSNKEEL